MPNNWWRPPAPPATEGYSRIEAYSPYPINELDEIIARHRTSCRWSSLCAGAAGTLTAWLMQYWIAAIHYPLNVGGRPLNSWPSFVIIMFELTVLFAARRHSSALCFSPAFPPCITHSSAWPASGVCRRTASSSASKRAMAASTSTVPRAFCVASSPSRSGRWTMNKLPLLIAAACLCACRRDMQDQPKYRPLAYSAFFPDSRSARPVPAGTIAVDDPVRQTPELTGLSGGEFLATIPVQSTRRCCIAARSATTSTAVPATEASAMAMEIAQRGFLAPMNLLSERVVNAPPGYLFRVITNGYGAMGRYGDQVDVADRWAIVAYIRALELSQGARIEDVPPAERGALESRQ